jgi:hypothetical protein
VDAAMAQNAVKAMQADYDKALERLKELGAYLTDEGNWEVPDLANQEEVITIVENVIDVYEGLVDASNAATKAYEDQQSAYDEASKQYDELTESIEGTTEAQEKGTEATKEYSDEAKKAASDGVKALADALKEVNDYVERTKKSTEDSINSALKGFKKYQTAREHIQELERQQKLNALEERAKSARESAAAFTGEGYADSTGDSETAQKLRKPAVSTRDIADVRKGFIWAKVLDEPRFKRRWSAQYR